MSRSVWNYHIGGYQAIKKWLIYWEKTMLGQRLKVGESEYVTEMARRIASIILLQSDLDANHDGIKNNTWS